MARNYDGVDDRIAYGSDASIDSFTLKTIAGWYNFAADGVTMQLVGKDTNANGMDHQRNIGNQILFGQLFSTNQGIWRTNNAFTGTARIHIAVTYDGGADTNDPIFYVNGAVEALTEALAPSGTFSGDAAQDLETGDNVALNRDMNGNQSCFVYDDAIMSAAEINRTLWWGRPYGGLQVYHPFWTDKLTNEGVATANGTASGTTVAAFAIPVVRPGSSMMGMGIGW